MQKSKNESESVYPSKVTDMQLPYERKRIIFYHLYFVGIEKPMIIQAESRKAALQFVAEEVTNRGIVAQLEDIKLTTPVYGVTEQTEGGIKYIWAGFERTQSGWMEEQAFKKL